MYIGFLFYCCFNILNANEYYIETIFNSHPVISELYEAITSSSNTCIFSCNDIVKKPTLNEKYVKEANGCGGYGFIVDFSSLADFEECCYVHELCYVTCNQSKDHCDDIFTECLHEKCKFNKIR